MSIVNLTKDEAVEFLIKVLNDGSLHRDLGELAEPLESAIRVAVAHLTNSETNKLAIAVEAIFQMYRRNDVADKAYRNAARFILSSVDGIPNRYESYDSSEDNRLNELVGYNKIKD